ncbi:Transketolase domain protein [Solidesulfovibrio fructosivorans JJ]]|uniref:Transketolase domain protein n=1 Tax=Solidesulfovibrio fructosivorans JJ] TaxID=596151 RepID=E1JXV5_SOLFR|nr:transketolase [Solidesulfovibrio fructosivorans]EFL50878.1 Transketolase domain protein [Solidesulfovibrio fructosivorans JJ]]
MGDDCIFDEDKVTPHALQRIASHVRYDIVALSGKARIAHVGSSLSCVDILVAAYFGGLALSPESCTLGSDRLLLGKGHAAVALYATLARRGYCAYRDLESHLAPGGPLQEHPGPACLPGTVAASGSLGHALPMGVGMALASRQLGTPYRVCVVLGDGECNEGTVWEAVMLAVARQCGNLVAIVDGNGWQGTGRTAEILAAEPLAEKFRAFGWEALDVDGHDVWHLRELLRRGPTHPDRPLVLIARTVKGKGVSFMEDDNNWHYRIPTPEETALAGKELLGQ